MARKFISAIHKSLEMTSFVQKLTVSSGKVIFMDLYVAEMNFLAMDKTFCLRKKVLSLTIQILSDTNYILSNQKAQA